MFSKHPFKVLSNLIIVVLIISGMWITPAYAAGVLFVKQNGTGNCSSWATSCSLQTALTNAVSGDEVWVAAGTYKPTTGADRTVSFLLIDGVALYGGFVGTELLRVSRNPVTNITILSGDLNGDDNSNVKFDELTRADNSYHVVIGAANATLDGFTITAGNANNIYQSNGGGMLNNSCSPSLANILFSNNSVSGQGGGMYSFRSDSLLTNVTFNHNNSAGEGGGMFNIVSNPTLINVTFTSNSATTQGGGVYNNFNNTGNITFTNVIFNGNSADWGGGIYNLNSGPSNPVISSATFSNNSAIIGGGMYNGSSNPDLTNVTFTDRRAHV